MTTYFQIMTPSRLIAAMWRRAMISTVVAANHTALCAVVSVSSKDGLRVRQPGSGSL